MIRASGAVDCMSVPFFCIECLSNNGFHSLSCARTGHFMAILFLSYFDYSVTVCLFVVYLSKFILLEPTL